MSAFDNILPATTRRVPRRKYRLFVIVILLGAMSFGIWFYTAPVVTFNNIRTAAKSNDRATLTRLVDFYALKVSVKENIKLRLGNVPGNQQHQLSLLSRFKSVVMNSLIDSVVEKVVTPEGIALLAAGVQPEINNSKLNQNALALPQSPPNGKTFAGPRIESGFENIDRYIIDYYNHSGVKEMSLVMHRNFLSWKLSEIRF